MTSQESQATTEEEEIPWITVGQDRPADGEPSTNGGEHWVCPDWDEGGGGIEDWQPVPGGDAQDHVHRGCGEDHGRDTRRHWVPEGKAITLSLSLHLCVELQPVNFHSILSMLVLTSRLLLLFCVIADELLHATVLIHRKLMSSLGRTWPRKMRMQSLKSWKAFCW